jgi:hypothetical protein
LNGRREDKEKCLEGVGGSSKGSDFSIQMLQDVFCELTLIQKQFISIAGGVGGVAMQGKLDPDSIFIPFKSYEAITIDF